MIEVKNLTKHYSLFGKSRSKGRKFLRKRGENYHFAGAKRSGEIHYD